MLYITATEEVIIKKLERCCEAHEQECRGAAQCQRFVDIHLLVRNRYRLPANWTMDDLSSFMYRLWHDGHISRQLPYRPDRMAQLDL